jgi:hypothetical protein
MDRIKPTGDKVVILRDANGNKIAILLRVERKDNVAKGKSYNANDKS